MFVPNQALWTGTVDVEVAAGSPFPSVSSVTDDKKKQNNSAVKKCVNKCHGVTVLM